MKKKSKGRIRKFEKNSNILPFSDDGARESDSRVYVDDGWQEEPYNTQALYNTPLYGNEGYGDSDGEWPDADFTRNESYEPSAGTGERFDIDAFMAEGWENISRKASQAGEKGAMSERGAAAGAGAFAGSRQRSDCPEEDSEIRAADAAIPQSRQAEMDKRKKKRSSARRRRRRLIYLAVAAVALVAVFFTARNVITLKLEERELLQEQRELEARKEELQEELTRVDEQDYIEQQAREQLHMIKPGEILYLLPEHDKEKDGK